MYWLRNVGSERFCTTFSTGAAHRRFDAILTRIKSDAMEKTLSDTLLRRSAIGASPWKLSIKNIRHLLVLVKKKEECVGNKYHSKFDPDKCKKLKTENMKMGISGLGLREFLISCKGFQRYLSNDFTPGLFHPGVQSPLYNGGSPFHWVPLF